MTASKWRNRQTRQLEGLVLARACGFKSRLRHQGNGPLFGAGRYLFYLLKAIWGQRLCCESHYDGFDERSRMRNVLFVAYESRADAQKLATAVGPHLENQHVTSRIHSADDHSVDDIDAETLVISMGGDGTFLRAARLAHQVGAQIMGVNLGRLGFLLNVQPEDLLSEIRKTLEGNCIIEQRLALRVTSPQTSIDEFALNEVVVERAQTGHMVRVKTFVDDEEYLTYAADGVMVATPTGSTGYNFSAGGPVANPSLSVMLLTPIAPHFTIDRTIIVGSDQRIRLESFGALATVVADGITVGSLALSEAIEVVRDPRPVQVVATQNFGLGVRLRQSLREGHA